MLKKADPSATLRDDKADEFGMTKLNGYGMTRLVERVMASCWRASELPGTRQLHQQQAIPEQQEGQQQVEDRPDAHEACLLHRMAGKRSVSCQRDAKLVRADPRMTKMRLPMYAALHMPTRRDLCFTLPALAVFREVFAQQPAAPAAQESKPDPAKIARGTGLFAQNEIFRWAEKPIATGKAASSQGIAQGALPTGEGVEMHNTVLAPGQEPHPPHRHEHSEWLLIREGSVEWLIDGQRQPAGPGDICYAASMQLHGIRNVGTTPARYFVMAVGPNLKG